MCWLILTNEPMNHAKRSLEQVGNALERNPDKMHSQLSGINNFLKDSKALKCFLSYLDIHQLKKLNFEKERSLVQKCLKEDSSRDYMEGTKTKQQKNTMLNPRDGARKKGLEDTAYLKIS